MWINIYTFSRLLYDYYTFIIRLLYVIRLVLNFYIQSFRDDIIQFEVVTAHIDIFEVVIAQ